MLKDALQKIGLQAKEAEAYLALLELGHASIKTIAQKAGIRRTSAYDVLERLRSHGLARLGAESNKATYYAEDPLEINNYLNEEEKLLADRKQYFTQLLPELRVIANRRAPFTPKIRFYQGKREVRKIFEDILNCENKEYWYIISREKAIAMVGKEFFYNFIRRRVAKQIKSYALRVVPQANAADRLKQFQVDNEELRAVAYLPPGVDFNSTIIIYDNKVAIFSSQQESFGFIVESAELANTVLRLFQLLWNNNTVSPR